MRVPERIYEFRYRTWRHYIVSFGLVIIGISFPWLAYKFSTEEMPALEFRLFSLFAALLFCVGLYFIALVINGKVVLRGGRLLSYGARGRLKASVTLGPETRLVRTAFGSNWYTVYKISDGTSTFTFEDGLVRGGRLIALLHEAGVVAQNFDWSVILRIKH